MKNDEHKLQTACVRWFDYVHAPAGHVLFAIPNGGARDARTGAMLKAEGVRAGVPDLQLITLSGSILFIEMKTDKGAVSKAQKEFIQKLNNCGQQVQVCRSFSDFETFINGVCNAK
jgi:hypothetical protein